MMEEKNCTLMLGHKALEAFNLAEWYVCFSSLSFQN